MKKVSAHRAKREFSELLSRVERGDCALHPPLLTPER
jgi:antitoxin (DNA-binding transcriptional repressor) of toxin-antitoxin stability system